MRHDQLMQVDSFAIVEAAAIAKVAAKPEYAVSEIPAAVGLMIVALYLLIIALFALTIATAGEAPFMIAIDVVFMAAFFTVPMILLKLEGDPARRPTFDRFMREGVQTYTGHVSGGGALTQMLIVPLLLAFAVLAMGVIANLV